MKPLVSIIIPTFKRSDKLVNAVDSALNQTYTNIEVIVVDDNVPSSSYRKETEDRMKKYVDNKRVIYIKHKENRNGSAARNTGIFASKGEYIAFLDDDDVFTRNKIESQLDRLLQLDESFGLCYSKYEVRNNGKLVYKGIESREGNLLDDALARNLFISAGSNLLIRRSVLLEVNGFDESFIRNQDIELLVRILFRYKIAYTKTLGLIVNKHVGFSVDSNIIAKAYLDKFNSYIFSLPKERQDRIYKLIYLQLIRYNILVKHDMRRGKSIMKEYHISIFQVLRYFIFLLYRKMMKISIGYKIRTF